MALQKQIVPINLGQGLDQKVDPKLLNLGKLAVLENAVFNKLGTLYKRNGYDVLSTNIEGSADLITQGSALGIYNDELNLYSGTKLYTYINSTNKWVDKGSVVSVIASAQSIIRNSYTQSNVSVGSVFGFTAYAWEDSRGGVWYSVIDQNTGSNLVSDVQLNANAIKPKIVQINSNKLLIFYVQTTDSTLRYQLISNTDLTNISASVILSSGIDTTNPNYDIVNNGTSLVAAFNHVSTKVQVQVLNSNLSLGPTADITGTANDCIDISIDSSGNNWVSWSNGTDVRYSILSFVLSEILAPTVIETITANIGNIICSPRDEVVFYEITQAVKSNTYIKTNTIDDAGNVGTPAVFKRSVGIASKPFYNDDNCYFNVIHDSTLQSTYFTYDIQGIVVAKLNAGNGGTLISNATPSYVPEVTSKSFVFANQLKGSVDSENNTTYSPLGVNSSLLSFNSENRFQNSQLGALHIVGGILQSYDGVNVVEHGFHLYPEGVTVTSATSGGALPAGTYQYSVCYEWTDNLGQIQRSAPSIPTSITLPTGSTLTKTGATITSGSRVITGLNNVTSMYVGMIVANANIPVGSVITSIDSASQITINLAATGSASGQSITSTSTNQPTVVIPTLRITAKAPPNRTNVRLVTYRTEANGSTFRRVSSVSSPTFNNVAVDTVSFIDNTSNYSSIFNDTLYTTGGVIENIAPPACSLITTWQTRIVLTGLEDRLAFWYSKQKIEGVPVEFSDFFKGTVDARGGDITAIGVIDSNLIIFKKSSIYALSGNGPNDTGTQNDLGQPQLITTDVGCDNPNSVVITPNGLMFKSTKGIYLLDRGLAVSFVGSPVEDFNGKLITGAALLTDTNQIRFTTNDNLALVYDYYFDQWSTFTNHTAEDCVVFNNKFVFLRNNGQVWQETPNQYLDNSSPIKLKLTTSWISLAGIQGFQRIYRMIVLGEYKSPHQLMVGISYNFNPNITQFETIDVNEIYDVSAYGGDSPYGEPEGITYGGEFPLYQFQTHMTEQKCQSVRFTFEDNQNSNVGEFGEGFNITNIALQIGIKSGLNKGATKNNFSTSS